MFTQYLKGKKTGIYYIDSTLLPAGKNQRIYDHKTFKYLTERDKTSREWFFGFKLHLIINEKQELISFKITRGNSPADASIVDLVKRINEGGKLFGDRGYLCTEEVRNQLKNNHNIELITKSRKNMKIKQKDTLSEENKRLLGKRNIVETVIGEIKRLTNIATTRIKSVANYFINIISSIVAYQLKIEMGWK